MIDLDSGKVLATRNITGKEVNALGYYPNNADPDSVVVQGDLQQPIAEGRSARIRVQETYTDPAGYTLQDGELVWKRTLGRPLNYVTLPSGWMLTSVNTPATISLDDEGRVKLRFVNPRNDELSVAIKARQREGYRFHLSLGTVADGLRAVDPSLLRSNDDRLSEPALIFERRGGTHGWRATFQNCPKKPMRDCEIRINSRSLSGFARQSDPAPVKDLQFDLGFSANDSGTVRTRCFRSSCRLRFGKAGAEQSEVLLHFGESKDIPLDVDIEVTFPAD